MVLVLLLVAGAAASQPGAPPDGGEPWEVVDGRAQAVVAPSTPRAGAGAKADRHRTPLHTALNLLVEVYRRGTDDQDFGSCPYRPSCSEYALVAAQAFGPVQGGLMTADRLLRCNPWSVRRYPRVAGGYHLDHPARGGPGPLEADPPREAQVSGAFAWHLRPGD